MPRDAEVNPIDAMFEVYLEAVRLEVNRQDGTRSLHDLSDKLLRTTRESNIDVPERVLRAMP